SSDTRWALCSIGGASFTISLSMPVSAKMGKGISRPGLTSVVKRSTTFFPSCTRIAISVMLLPAAYPPVVSISTMAYSIGRAFDFTLLRYLAYRQLASTISHFTQFCFTRWQRRRTALLKVVGEMPFAFFPGKFALVVIRRTVTGD